MVAVVITVAAKIMNFGHCGHGGLVKKKRTHKVKRTIQQQTQHHQQNGLTLTRVVLYLSLWLR